MDTADSMRTSTIPLLIRNIENNYCKHLGKNNLRNRKNLVFITDLNKRLLQQPALGALTFLRSFVAGKANFCSQLLASLVHLTVVNSQAILIIRLGAAEVISAIT